VVAGIVVGVREVVAVDEIAVGGVGAADAGKSIQCSFRQYNPAWWIGATIRANYPDRVAA
jgi:hypothetical protein